MATTSKIDEAKELIKAGLKRELILKITSISEHEYSLLQREARGHGAAQGAHHAAAAQRLPDVVAERAYVGPFGAADAQVPFLRPLLPR